MPGRPVSGTKLLHPLLWTAFAVALFLLLPILFGVGLRDIVQSCRSVPIWTIGIVAALHAILILLGSRKWQILLHEVPAIPIRIPLGAAIGGTTLGTLLGQVLPIQAVTPIARAWVGRRHDVPTASGIGTSLYEQLFDAVTLACVALVSVLVLAADLTTPAITLLSVIVFGVAAFAIRPTLLLCARLAGTLALGPLRRFATPFADALQSAARLRTTPLRSLMTLSLARYALLAALNIMLLKSILPDADALHLLLAYPLILLALSIPVFPGGLGVVEATWTGVLVSAGFDNAVAVEASIALRIVSTVAFLGVAPVLLLVSRQRGETP